MDQTSHRETPEDRLEEAPHGEASGQAAGTTDADVGALPTGSTFRPENGSGKPADESQGFRRYHIDLLSADEAESVPSGKLAFQGGQASPAAASTRPPQPAPELELAPELAPEQPQPGVVPTPPADPLPLTDAEMPPDLDAWRAELAKWRERVPRLAAALRQRTDEAEALERALEKARDDAAVNDQTATLQAREDRITELEARVGTLTERQRAAADDLRNRELALEQQRTETETWKTKWQSLDSALEEMAAEAHGRNERSRILERDNADLRRRLADQVEMNTAGRTALDDTAAEMDSLKIRNEQLFETTELANRQITSLTDGLAELRGKLKETRARADALETAESAAAAALADREASLAELQQLAARQADEIAAAERAAAERDQAGAEQQRALAAAQERERAARLVEQVLTEDIQVLCAAAQASAAAGTGLDELQEQRDVAGQRAASAEGRRDELEAALAVQQAEVSRLSAVLDGAERTVSERDAERRTLAEQQQMLERRIHHLEQQLEERSALVVTLERDHAEAERLSQAARKERDESEGALLTAQRHVKDNAEHVARLDDKLERQKELMESLEEELAEARNEQADELRARAAALTAKTAENDRLQGQIRKLETIVRERSDELNRLRWQQSLIEAPAAGRQAQTGADAPDPDAADAGAIDPAAAGPGDSGGREGNGKMLLVLNQQLEAARTHNDQLLAEVRNLEARLRQQGRGDDLTRIHGVGQKLAEQLNELGIFHFQQIAELEVAALGEEGHALYAHRSRILRDAWIDQAGRLARH